MVFSLPSNLVKTLVKNLAKNLVKNLAKNLAKNLVKNYKTSSCTKIQELVNTKEQLRRTNKKIKQSLNTTYTLPKGAISAF